MRRLGLSVLLLLVSLGAHAEGEGQKDFSAYVGAGPALAFPYTLRVGYNDWEGGQLTGEAYGFDKVFRSDWTYIAFGLAVVPYAPIGAGFYGAAGLEVNLFWGLTVRGELNGVAASNGYVRGEASLGLGFHI